MKYLFDLDGTLTCQETLPVIASHFNCAEEIAELTRKTVQGDIPFPDSLTSRVIILGQYPVSETSALLARIPVYPQIRQFIDAHRPDCIVVTGNLTCWCKGIFEMLGCLCFGSEAEVADDKVVKIRSILRKEDIVDRYRALGHKVVFAGDGGNDAEAMRHADISIAVGLTHVPAPSILAICDHTAFDEHTLCQLLESL
jgi:HAD superfamily phosphoserine phosphatase-like hydrolase